MFDKYDLFWVEIELGKMQSTSDVADVLEKVVAQLRSGSICGGIPGEGCHGGDQIGGFGNAKGDA